MDDMQFEVIRKVTMQECWWLLRDYEAGEKLYRYSGPTYGIIDTGIACSLNGSEPFFEMPRDALREITNKSGVMRDELLP